MSPTLIIVLLSMFMGIQPVATDLYLPALPAIKTEFGAELSQVQLTLSALLLAFGTSQLVWGPLSDRLAVARFCCGVLAHSPLQAWAV